MDAVGEWVDHGYSARPRGGAGRSLLPKADSLHSRAQNIPGHKEESEAIAQLLLQGVTIQDGSPSRKTTKTKAAKDTTPSANQPAFAEALQALYVLAVILLDESITDKFLKKIRRSSER